MDAGRTVDVLGHGHSDVSHRNTVSQFHIRIARAYQRGQQLDRQQGGTRASPTRRRPVLPVGGGAAILRRMAGHGMVFLGFGKYVRADRIYALEPILGEDRGSGSRTLVWVEGIPEPAVASRTQQTILDEIEASTVPVGVRRRTGRGSLTRHPQLFEGE